MTSVRLFCAGVAVSLLASCAERHEPTNKEEALESATGANVKVDQGDSSETIVFEDGEATTTIASGKKLAAPANYPSYGYLPDDAVIKSSASQDVGMIIVYTVPGPLTGAFDRNRKALRDRGWTEEDVMSIEHGAGYVSYLRGEASLSEEFVTDAEGRVEVTQTYDSGR